MSTARSDYAPTRQPAPERGGLIAAVAPSSPAARAGITPGDSIISVFDEPVRDILDWQWASDMDTVVVEVVAPGGSPRAVTMTREPSESWGLDLADTVFDGVRTCENNCAFCFMSQLPRGLRSSLYLRDDDFRLSFLQGNFITLTNLTDSDVERIVAQRLSPLYVSLHAVSPDVRSALVCARDDCALERFDELLEGGIDLHVQVVLVPGINDGAVLDETLRWLAAREGVLSVGIVPLGYTRHQVRFAAGFESGDAARAVIDQIAPWQEALRARDGTTWVHLADEFYLNARQEPPPAVAYDDFPQYENGIGIARDFIDSCELLASSLTQAAGSITQRGGSAVVVTGELAAALMVETLSRVLTEESAPAVRVLPVENAFFGGNVAVAGLLVGADLARAIAADAAGVTPPGRGMRSGPGEPPAHPRGIYLVPDLVFNADGLTLDGMTLEHLRDRTGAELCLVSSDAAGVLDGFRQAANLIGPPVTG